MFGTIFDSRYKTHQNGRLRDVLTNMGALRGNNGHVYIWTTPAGRKCDSGNFESSDFFSPLFVPLETQGF